MNRYKLNGIISILLSIFLFACQSTTNQNQNNKDKSERYTYRGWNLLSNHRENGLQTLDAAAENGVNHLELSHYQLCHFLSDMKKEKNREDVNFFIKEAHKRGIEDVFIWDHAFYNIDYYPQKFKVKSKGNQDFKHHT